jgi:hypothetical protein
VRAVEEPVVLHVLCDRSGLTLRGKRIAEQDGEATDVRSELTIVHFTKGLSVEHLTVLGGSPAAEAGTPQGTSDTTIVPKQPLHSANRRPVEACSRSMPRMPRAMC